VDRGMREKQLPDFWDRWGDSLMHLQLVPYFMFASKFKMVAFLY
jgi:hypothetical protein